jgi:hypothetical protein
MNVLNLVERAPTQRGFTTIFSFNQKTEQISQLTYQKNQIMDLITLCSARLFGGSISYKAGAMYFEYQNLANEGDSPTPPAFEKDDTVEYYTGLQYSADVDFIRVPILVSPSVVETDYGHLLTLYAVTPGEDEGFWGKPFDAVNNSAVYGGAVVATPAPSTQSNDVVIARNYPTGAKVLKSAGEQICMVWNIEFLKQGES